MEIKGANNGIWLYGKVILRKYPSSFFLTLLKIDRLETDVDNLGILGLHPLTKMENSTIATQVVVSILELEEVNTHQ